MRLRYLVTLAAAGLLAAFAATAFGAIEKVELVTKMSGKKVISADDGDRDAKGAGEFKVNVPKRKLKYVIEYEDMEDANAGHIHKGNKTNTGPVKVELFAELVESPVEGVVKGVRKGLLRKLAREPKEFYVNLHNEPFPDGAIRGQLKPVRDRD